MKGGEWRWALVLVASVHLLSIAGGWQVTDHGEMLHMARRILTRGTLDLRSPGDAPNGFMSAPAAIPERPIRSRFVPGTSVTLAPLLLVDEAMGWGNDKQYGRVVHLHGELFGLAGLTLLGWTVRRSGGSPQATALAIVLTGLAWPFWMTSRHVGPEPVLAFLVAGFLAAGARNDDPEGGRKRWPLAEATIVVLLPWVHSTGPIISLALVASRFVEELVRDDAGTDRLQGALVSVWPLAAASAAGVLSVVGLWNHAYHGSWWAGGYAQFMWDRFFRTRNPLVGLWVYGNGFALQALPLLVVAGLGARARWRPLTPGLASALCLTAVLVVFFAPFSTDEPARRLAAACPAWGVVVGSVWDRLGWRAPTAQLVSAAAGLIGLYWLLGEAPGFYFTRWGIFYFPQVLWLRLALAGAPLWQTVGPVLALMGAALLSLGRVWALFRATPSMESAHSADPIGSRPPR